MDLQQILLAKTLEAANIPLKISTPDNRLIIHKSVYILQNAKINLGYRFRWYQRGPYSPEVIPSIEGIIDEGQAAYNELQTWRLDETSKQIAIRYSKLLDNKAHKLELLASILFLIKTEQASKISHISQKNKNTTIKDLRQAIRELREYHLI